jgi:hypothetical protein
VQTQRVDRIAFVYDRRPDREDYEAYSLVTDSFVNPILAHLPEGVGAKVTDPDPDALNVRFYTWPLPQQQVFISHGIADKNYRTPSKLFGFTWIHSTGPWWTEYYRRRGGAEAAGKVFETGYTKLDPLFPFEREPAPDGRVRVLWAPTHAGVQGRSVTYPSAYLELKDAIDTLLPADEFAVEVAPHPRLREGAGLPPKVTLEEYRRADVVIADGGSTLYEAWALGLPAVVPTWITDHKVRRRWAQALEGEVYRERIGYHVDNPSQLAATVTTAARDGMGARESALIEAVFPASYRGDSGRRTAGALLDIISRPIPAFEPPSRFWIVHQETGQHEFVTPKQFLAIFRERGFVRAEEGRVP